MANDNPTPKRRWSRVRLAAVVLLGLPLLLGLEAYRRHRRVQWLVSEIEAGGGWVRLPDSLLDQLREGEWSNLDKDVYVGFSRDIEDGQPQGCDRKGGW